jgi:HEAT repeat protein
MSETVPPPAPSAPPPAAEGPEPAGTSFLVLQFFIFPMAIVAVCVAVFVVFGLIAAEGKSAREYVAEVRAGSATRRWQAAFELSKTIQAHTDPALRDPRFVDELLGAFEGADKDDPRVRRYLALALGRIGDARAVPALLRVLGQDAPDADSETLIYAIAALGSIRDPAAVPELVRLAGCDDPGLRKVAVHALGGMPGAAARDRLRQSLSDGVEDVRWNAALQLARRGDSSAVPVVRDMLDRGHLDTVKDLTPEQREDAMLQAVAAAGVLDDRELHATLLRLSQEDPSLKLRDAAGAALRARGGSAAR